MKLKTLNITVFIITLITMNNLSCINKNKNEYSIAVYYPIVAFDNNLLINPANLDTIWEYYLLENLSTGLIRDDSHSPSGYRGGIAKTWSQLASDIWNFQIDENAKWSNGSTITLSEIKSNLMRIKNSTSRHIVALDNLNDIHINENNHSISLHFNSPTAESLIHELSLADSSILHDLNLSDDWTITSGPYFIKSHKKGESIELQENSYSAFKDKQMPSNVILGSAATRGGVLEYSKSNKIDLFNLPNPPYREYIPKLQTLLPNEFLGEPIALFYLTFLKDRYLNDKLARIEISTFINQIFIPPTAPEKYFYKTNQYIPNGYPGHLPKSVIKNSYDKIQNKAKSAPAKIQIHIPLGINFPANYIDKLAKSAKNTELKFNFSNKPSSDDDLSLSVFYGNQKDPLGSWNFLFSDGPGPLSSFRKKFNPKLKALGQEQGSNYEKKLELFHADVIQNFIAIPLWHSRGTFLHSNRISLERFNPFDMRMRFYEIRMVK